MRGGVFDEEVRWFKRGLLVAAFQRHLTVDGVARELELARPYVHKVMDEHGLDAAWRAAVKEKRRSLNDALREARAWERVEQERQRLGLQRLSVVGSDLPERGRR